MPSPSLVCVLKRLMPAWRGGACFEPLRRSSFELIRILSYELFCQLPDILPGLCMWGEAWDFLGVSAFLQARLIGLWRPDLDTSCCEVRPFEVGGELDLTACALFGVVGLSLPLLCFDIYGVY